MLFIFNLVYLQFLQPEPSTSTSMLRLLLLPLFLFTLSMACMGQTFQYSRGWTNGKRAPPAAAVLTNGHNLGLLDLYEVPDATSDRRLER